MVTCRHLTSVPHVAGTVRDREQAEWLKDRFMESGLDEAKTVPYEVLLSYPRSDGVVNRVSLIDSQGNVQFETVGRQKPLGPPEEFLDEVQVNFNAYSASGVVEVYMNNYSNVLPGFFLLFVHTSGRYSLCIFWSRRGLQIPRKSQH